MKNHRTRSQERIVKVLKSLNCAISAQDLYIELRNRQQNMGLATVYRSLESLKLQGEVKVRTMPNGESLYSSVQQDRHYFTCVNCGASIAIDECPVHQLERDLEHSLKSKVYYHTLEFFGLCEKCQLSSVSG
ncbi:MAG: Fur family transcriptional regulator [Xenococcaceae cyanobacterium]